MGERPEPEVADSSLNELCWTPKPVISAYISWATTSAGESVRNLPQQFQLPCKTGNCLLDGQDECESQTGKWPGLRAPGLSSKVRPGRAKG